MKRINNVNKKENKIPSNWKKREEVKKQIFFTQNVI